MHAMLALHALLPCLRPAFRACALLTCAPSAHVPTKHGWIGWYSARAGGQAQNLPGTPASLYVFKSFCNLEVAPREHFLATFQTLLVYIVIFFLIKFLFLIYCHLSKVKALYHNGDGLPWALGWRQILIASVLLLAINRISNGNAPGLHKRQGSCL